MFCSTVGGKTADYKMAEIDVQFKKQAVKTFLVAEGDKLTCIHECFLEV